ncbi:class I SAM-dependent methyltransferase [Algibacter amylolyticus]|uniref:Class I SAM-dependent methyltransferase n=1 Tax=Algibacter amylolyticus TaxID=1608400 RepID=A0A5M7AVQ6_9FLAO|nr:class I SAM-dependent methyltransferase [Algibacter amylolyticus]KAA5821483.1 class I SAM-dependent methyltransferase [Algibacter amylolyticus]MBB5268360.1 2-polyprenyl-3-methyl-5-hydroxy-6-metoxy-1,4-benzoquinol methylase [Algibacter amylolyticus]TSJ72995.1 class I SAM-dependent methyltransferase [Algibacter amylolyticus]
MLSRRLKNDGVSILRLNELQIEIKKQIDNKVEIGNYHFEYISCPICNSNDKDLIGEKDRYGLFFSTNLCQKCGLVYTSPRMIQESYNSFYNLEYRKLYGGSEEVSPTFFQFQKKFGKRIYTFLSNHNLLSKTPINVLEVGCGAGGILDHFRDEGHFVKGIDLGEKYINYGISKYNLDLEVGSLKDITLEVKPDLIIYSHVLEHILDLNYELSLLKKHIKPETIVYIEVPGIKEIHKNYNYDILKYFQNAHTFHFTLNSLTNLFNKHGFELIYGNQFVMSAFKFKGDLDRIPISDYGDVKTYMSSLESKRKLNEIYLFLSKKNKLILFKILHFTGTYNFVKKLYNRY